MSGTSKHPSKTNGLGGTESLTAISDLYRCTILTIWENGTTTKIVGNESIESNQLRIVYRKAGRGWIHYDSFLCSEGISLKGITSASGYVVNEPPTIVESSMHSECPVDMDCDCSVIETERQTLQKVIIDADTDMCHEPSHASESHAVPILDDMQRDCVLPGPRTCNPRQISGMSGIANVSKQLKLGCWNIRGGSSEGKRNMIDAHLSAFQFGIVCIQESKMSSVECATTHYQWILGMGEGKDRVYRGVAILVHLSCIHLIMKVHNVS